MRALLFTATAFFVSITALLAVYALQTPVSIGGAKVVLSIDSSSMPKEADTWKNPPVYGEEDTKPADGSQVVREARPSEDAAGGGSDPLAQASQDPIPASEEPNQERQASAALQGTILGNMDETGAAPRERPASESRQFAAAPDISTTQQLPQQTAARTEPPVSTHLSTVEDPLQTAAQPRQDAVSSQQQARPEAAQPVTPPPPPLPVRRPAAVPQPVRVAATPGGTAAGGWAGTQIPTDAASGKLVRIGLLIRGIGQDRRDTNDAISKLPPAVSLGVVAAGDDAADWASKAKAAGHEVIVQLPFEPADYPASTSGPDTLLSTSAPQENTQRLRSVLGRFQGFGGVTNFNGGKLLQSRDALKPILEDLKVRGVTYIGEGNNSHAVVRQLAQELKMRYGNAAIIIDIQPTPDGIKKALDRLVAHAQKYGTAIGMGVASASTIEQIQMWSETLNSQGVTLVPVSSLAQAL